VILVDANLLIYAIDADSPQHERARPWLERVLSDAAPVGLPWIVILAFVRITTRAGIMRRPLSPADALAYSATSPRNSGSSSSRPMPAKRSRRRLASGFLGALSPLTALRRISRTSSPVLRPCRHARRCNRALTSSSRFRIRS
jgi:predicted nucleic acid-binding protein